MHFAQFLSHIIFIRYNIEILCNEHNKNLSCSLKPSPTIMFLHVDSNTWICWWIAVDHMFNNIFWTSIIKGNITVMSHEHHGISSNCNSTVFSTAYSSEQQRNHQSSTYSCGKHPHIMTHWGQDTTAAIFQTTFSNAFSLMKMSEFRLKLQWSLFRRVQLTIFLHWFR